MKHVLDTYRIFKEEDTTIIRTIRLIVHYSQVYGPFEDATYLFPDYPDVTAFREKDGTFICVLEPMDKVYQAWACYRADEEKKGIFSLQ